MHYARAVMRRLCSLMVLWSGFALASGADVDAALGRFTSARNQQETMLLIGALLAVGAFVGWTVYARRKK